MLFTSIIFDRWWTLQVFHYLSWTATISGFGATDNLVVLEMRLYKLEKDFGWKKPLIIKKRVKLLPLTCSRPAFSSCTPLPRPTEPWGSLAWARPRRQSLWRRGKPCCQRWRWPPIPRNSPRRLWKKESLSNRSFDFRVAKDAYRLSWGPPWPRLKG